jgi:hypothetical protein
MTQLAVKLAAGPTLPKLAKGHDRPSCLIVPNQLTTGQLRRHGERAIQHGRRGRCNRSQQLIASGWPTTPAFRKRTATPSWRPTRLSKQKSCAPNWKL